MRATVTEVERKKTGSAQITTTQVFEAEGIDKPVCVAESIGFFTEYGAEV